MNPLRLLVDAFVNTFGITQPSPEAEARAGRYIALMLAAVLLFLGLAAWVLRAAFTVSMNNIASARSTNRSLTVTRQTSPENMVRAKL